MFNLSAYLVETTLAVSVGDDLDSGLCAIGDIQVRGDADIAQAEFAKARHLDLRVQNNAEAIAWVVADSQVHSQVGLLVPQFELDRCTADGEVGAL